MLRTVAMLAGVAAFAAVVAPRLLDSEHSDTITAARLSDEEGLDQALATVSLRAGRGGHFHADANVNGLSMPVLVDTGASVVALTYQDGKRLGLITNGDRWDMKVQTANGIARAKRVELDSVRIGGIIVRKVAAVVTDEGAMATNLLGMSFLNRLGRFEMRDGRLVMEE